MTAQAPSTQQHTTHFDDCGCQSARLRQECDEWKQRFDAACAVLQLPDSTNDGGPGDLAQAIRDLIHNYETLLRGFLPPSYPSCNCSIGTEPAATWTSTSEAWYAPTWYTPTWYTPTPPTVPAPKPKQAEEKALKEAQAKIKELEARVAELMEQKATLRVSMSIVADYVDKLCKELSE